jgi:hypothetical protein
MRRFYEKLMTKSYAEKLENSQHIHRQRINIKNSYNNSYTKNKYKLVIILLVNNFYLHEL